MLGRSMLSDFLHWFEVSVIERKKLKSNWCHHFVSKLANTALSNIQVLATIFCFHVSVFWNVILCFNGNIFDPEKLFLERIAKQCHWLVHITTYLPDFCNRTTCNFDWPVKVKQVFIRDFCDVMSALKCL
jgi:hypothetical protein